MASMDSERERERESRERGQAMVILREYEAAETSFGRSFFVGSNGVVGKTDDDDDATAVSLLVLPALHG